MKKILLTLLIAGLGCSLAVNASQGPRCQGGQCQRKEVHHGHHHAHPTWRDMEGNPNSIEVKENDQWIEYRKSNKNCPPMAHRHGHWERHPHHEHRHKEAQGQHAHKHWHHGSHQSGRRVKYQKNQDGSRVEGIMNVQEHNGECWEYRRAISRSTLTGNKALIEAMEENLEVD